MSHAHHPSSPSPLGDDIDRRNSSITSATSLSTSNVNNLDERNNVVLQVQQSTNLTPSATIIRNNNIIRNSNHGSTPSSSSSSTTSAVSIANNSSVQSLPSSAQKIVWSFSNPSSASVSNLQNTKMITLTTPNGQSIKIPQYVKPSAGQSSAANNNTLNVGTPHLITQAEFQAYLSKHQASSNSANLSITTSSSTTASSSSLAASETISSGNHHHQSGSSNSSLCNNNNAQRFISRLPIVDEGMAQCKRCNTIAAKDSFFGKGKQFCSTNCARGAVAASNSAINTSVSGTVGGGVVPQRQQLLKLYKIAPDSSGFPVALPITTTTTYATIPNPIQQQTAGQTQTSSDDHAAQQQQQQQPQPTTNVRKQQSSVEQQTDPSTVVMSSTAPTSTSITTNNWTPLTSGTVKHRLIIRHPAQSSLATAGRQIIAQRPTGSHLIGSFVNQKQSTLVGNVAQQSTPSIQIESPSQQQQQSPSSATIAQIQAQTSQINKDLKRSYTKMIALANQQQQLNAQHQIQLANNNGTLVAVNLNNQNPSNGGASSSGNAGGTFQPQMSAATSGATATPKRTKKNSQPQQQQQNGGQTTNPVTKRSRSKSNSSTSSNQSATFAENSFVNSNSNTNVDDGISAVSTIINQSNDPNANKQSANSILISQLKKPVGALSLPETTGTTTTTTGILTSNQSIQTSSSPLFVHLASISNSGNSGSSQLSRSITTTATPISNQQLQQFLSQTNSFRIASQVGLNQSSITAIPIRTSNSVGNNAAGNAGNHHILAQNNGSSTTSTTATPIVTTTDLSQITKMLQMHQQQQQQKKLQQNQINQQQVINANNNFVIAQNNLSDHHHQQQSHRNQQTPQNKNSSSSKAVLMTRKPETQTPTPTKKQSMPTIKPQVAIPKPINRLEEIRALDVAVLNAINNMSGTYSTNSIGGSAATGNSGNSGNVSTNQYNNNNLTRTNYVNSNNNSTGFDFGSHNSNHNPPTWGLIFDKYGHNRCAPVGAFPNSPLHKLWPTVIGMDGEDGKQKCYFEIRLSDQDLLQPNGTMMTSANSNNTLTTGGNLTPNKAKSNKKNSSFDFNIHNPNIQERDKFWFVEIVGHSGYYLRVRYVGLENFNRYDFWVNIRFKNLYPIFYAKNNHFSYKPPIEVLENNPNYMADVRRFLNPSQKYIKTDLYSLFLKEVETDLKPGTKVELVDKNRFNCFRIATITQIIGKRCLLHYDGALNDDPGWWTHVNSEYIRPIGWSLLVGHKLFASEEYRMKALQRGVQNIRHHIKVNNNRPDWNKFGVLKKFEFINEDLLFQEGMKLEVVNPWNLSSICVATVRKVLRFNFIVLSIDDMIMDHKPYSNFNLQLSPVQQSSSHHYNPLELEERMFCVHASSPYILPAGFCSTFDIPLTPPKGYKQTFDWVEYCNLTNSLMAPINFFSYEHFITDKDTKLNSAGQTGDKSSSTTNAMNETDHNRFVCRFEEGMLLEAVDMMVPELVCVAVIKKRAGRLLLLHFIGWDDNYDQWCDCCSPNIFPVGYCHLVVYPLQGPPSQSKKKRRNNSQGHVGFSNRKKNKKTFITSPKTRSPRGQAKNTDNHLIETKDNFDEHNNSNDYERKTTFDSVDHFNGNLSTDDEHEDHIDDDDGGDEKSIKKDYDNESDQDDEDDDAGDGGNEDDEADKDQIIDVWAQSLDRERSELYNFLSWDETITNRGLLNDYNKFVLPLKSRINIGDDRWIRFSRNTILKPSRFQIRLVHDKYRFDVEWSHKTEASLENDSDSETENGANNDDGNSGGGQHRYQRQNVYGKGKYKIYDSYQYFDPEDKGPDGTSDLRLLPHWSPKQVSKFMYRNGFADLCDSLLVYKIDGKRLLSLTRTQAIQIALTPSATNRFISFIDSIQKQLVQHQNRK